MADPVNPDVDPQTGSGEIVAVPIADIREQADPTTSPFGEQNDPQVPASEVRYSAKE